MKKVLRFLSSMKFAIVLLIILGLASIGGTLLPQGGQEAFYLDRYGTSLGGLILFLGLDNAYSTWWYIGLAALLVISLLFCVILRVKPIISMVKRKSLKAASKKLGSWLLHFGLMLVIVFFALSSAFAKDTIVRGAPGTYQQVAETGIFIHFDDFEIPVSEGQYVDQYITDVHLTDVNNQPLTQAEISVNHPLTYEGIQFSQSSYGNALDLTISKEGQALGKTVLYEGEYAYFTEDALVVELLALFPDYIETPDGPSTKSMDFNNPYMLYRIYYNSNIMDMNLVPVGTPLMAMDYEIDTENPRLYSVLQVRYDPFKTPIFISSLIFILGIILVFFGPSENTKKVGVSHGGEEEAGPVDNTSGEATSLDEAENAKEVGKKKEKAKKKPNKEKDSK